MATRSFIVGTRKEKEEIERLLFRYQPGNVSYEYAFLCNSLLEMMYEYGVRSMNEYDYVVCEFLYEVKTDVRERLERCTDNFEDYLLDIEKALDYFRVYMETLDCIPIPFNESERRNKKFCNDFRSRTLKKY